MAVTMNTFKCPRHMYILYITYCNRRSSKWQHPASSLIQQFFEAVQTSKLYTLHALLALKSSLHILHQAGTK